MNGHAPAAYPEAKGPISQLIEALSLQAQGLPAKLAFSGAGTGRGADNCDGVSDWVNFLAAQAPQSNKQQV
jgi:hypothetical protein